MVTQTLCECGCGLVVERRFVKGHNRASPIQEGARFGRLGVLWESPNRAQRSRWYFCTCDCGALTEVMGKELRNGHTRSCGCLVRDINARLAAEKFTRHGHSPRGKRSPTYASWHAMINRCHTNPANRQWKNYGGRGISVCNRWRNSFADFLDDMGERPGGTTLDRIDPDGNYEPSNCRWATPTEQARTTRKAKSLA